MKRTRYLLLFSIVGLLVAYPCAGDDSPPALRGAYSHDGRLHVGLFGGPDGVPITAGTFDIKPSWSKTGDKIVFFRVLTFNPDMMKWKTAICVVNADGSGFKQLTDGTQTDFNPTWSRDGKKRIFFNRRDAATGRFLVHMTTAEAQPGDEVPVSDPDRSTFSTTCLKDGRIFVTSWGRGIQDYCFLMTPGIGRKAGYEPVTFSPPLQGILERASISPSETRICYDFQKSAGPSQYPGRTIYIADLDVATRTVSNFVAVSDLNPDPKTMTIYPAWTGDERAVVYHSDKSGTYQLYLYNLKDKSTARVSANPAAGYLFGCGEATPK